ncbi:MAG: methyltransferase domain-containing protein [Pseudomonadota bacterium]
MTASPRKNFKALLDAVTPRKQPEAAFAGREFQTLSCDEWDARYAPALERITVRVRSGGDGLQWVFRGGLVKTSLADALGQAFPEIEKRQLLRLEVDDVAHRDIATLAKEISGRFFPVVITDVRSKGDGPVNAVSSYWIQLERALFKTGLRKHAAYCALSGPATQRPAEFGRHFGCYEQLPESFANRDPAHLAETRDLHMDMLREAGPRSDAHLVRYHFAANCILDAVGPGGAILDACSGMGYGTKMLSVLSQAALTTGVDIDANAIAYASDVFGQADGIAFTQDDILSHLRGLETESLDAIVMFEGLEHVVDVEDILCEANRVLRPQGVMVSSVPNAWVNEEGIDENPWHVRVFDWDVYRATLSTHLSIRTMLRQIGNRINTAGKWAAHDACFAPVETGLPTPEPAEWWLAVCQKRNVPGQAPPDPAGGRSFELQEAFARLDDPNIMVVSFDIFDTLLSRPTLMPDDVFDILQMQLVARHGLLFSGFAALRRKAEAQARQIAHKKGLGDITFYEIYDCLAPMMALGPTQRQAVQSAELALERQFLKPRKGVQQIYHRAVALGKKVIVVSDMYLPPDFLSEVLASQGYDTVFRLWVSSAHMVQKRTGRLYDVLLDALKSHNIQADQILHIGDNKCSDIDAAAAHGLQTLYTAKATAAYAGETKLWPSGPAMKSAPQVSLGLRSFVGCQIDVTFQDPLFRISKGTVFDRDPYLYGRLRMGAFVYFAMDDLFRRCSAIGIDRVLFATRDGHVAKTVFERIAAQRGQGITVADLNVSRAVLQLLSVQGQDDLQRLLSLQVAQQKQGSLIDHLAGLMGGSPDALLTQLSETVAVDQGLLITPLADQTAHGMRTMVDQVWPIIGDALAERRNRALAHLTATDPAKTAIWDIGYFHSAATALAECGHNMQLSSHLVTLAHHEARVAWHDSRYRRHSFLGQISNTRDTHPFTTAEHALLLELLLSDPSTASRRCYTVDGQPVVETEDLTLQSHNSETLNALHHGICDAADSFIAAYGNTLDHVEISPTDLLSYAFAPPAIAELLESRDLVFDNNGLTKVASVDGKIVTQRL